MTFSRPGGLETETGALGNQRYPVGMSGDVLQDYASLAFEVEYTPQASNVLFGYFSHTIGGFHLGAGIRGDGDTYHAAIVPQFWCSNEQRTA